MVMEMFHRIQDDERFLDSVIFSDKSTFQYCRIWGSENLRVSLEHARDSPKVNVFCALSKECGPLFVMEMTITGIVYLDMLQQFLIPQLDEDDQGEHSLTARRRTPSIPWRSAFPRSVVERRRYYGYLVPRILHPWMECSYQLCLQMSLSSELELLPRFISDVRDAT
jgi:hypothetical protein